MTKRRGKKFGAKYRLAAYSSRIPAQVASMWLNWWVNNMNSFFWNHLPAKYNYYYYLILPQLPLIQCSKLNLESPSKLKFFRNKVRIGRVSIVDYSHTHLNKFKCLPAYWRTWAPQADSCLVVYLLAPFL